MAEGKGQAISQKRNDVSRHEAFVELHNLSRTHSEEFVVPEIVLIGGDLHTRVAMLQTILGVRLTISEFEEKLKLPVVIESLHNSACRTPDVRVFNPSAQSFTPSISLSFESALADAVLSAQAQINDGSPVIIKCQSTMSPNLQLVLPKQAVITVAAEAADGEEQDYTVSMLSAKKLSRQLTPRHRLIVVVTNAKDTPVDNVGLQAALKADRQMTRTIVLAALHLSDVKTFQTGDPQAKKLQLLADDFLSALHPGFPPPPVAAVVVPSATKASAWPQALTAAEEAAAAAAKFLVGAGTAPPVVGASATGQLLEAELASRQQAATHGLLSMLQMRSDGARVRAQEAEAAMSAMMDAGQLRASHMRTVTGLLDCFTALLDGNGTIDMAQHGLTSAEECARLSDDPWPMVDIGEGGEGECDAESAMMPVGAGSVGDVSLGGLVKSASARQALVAAGMTADVPLYGMAAAERCLEEFDELLESEAEFGSDTWHASRRLFDVHRIANMLLASEEAGAPRGQAMSAHAMAEQDAIFPYASPDAQRRVGHAMGRTAADQLLQPLTRALCSRLSAALTRLPALALAEQESRTASGLGGSLLPPQLADSFRSALEGQVKDLVSSVLEHLRQQIATVIKHTAVPAPWPLAYESPLFEAAGRCGSVSSVSSRHYRMGPSDGGMAQAVGEGLESRGSSIAGLAAAMGRTSAPADDEEDSADESDDEESEDEEESEEEASVAEPAAPPPRAVAAPAAPPPPASLQGQQDEEEDNEDEEEEEEEILTTVSMERPAPRPSVAPVPPAPPAPARVPSRKATARAPEPESEEEEEEAAAVPAARRPSMSAPGAVADPQLSRGDGKRSKKKGAKAAAAPADAPAAPALVTVEETVPVADAGQAGKVSAKKKKSKKAVEVAPAKEDASHKPAVEAVALPSELPVQPSTSVEEPTEAAPRKKKKKKKVVEVLEGGAPEAVAAEDAEGGHGAAEGDGGVAEAAVARQRSVKKTRSVTVRTDDAAVLEGGSEAAGGAEQEDQPAEQGGDGTAGGERQGGLQRSESAVLESAAAQHPVYRGVMAHVEAMFGEIKQGVISYGIANCMRATLLQPISSLSLKQTVMLRLFSGSDDDIMAKYGSQETLHLARCALEVAQEHHAALMRCRRLFEGIVTAEGAGASGAGSIWGGIDMGAGGFNSYA